MTLAVQADQELDAGTLETVLQNISKLFSGLSKEAARATSEALLQGHFGFTLPCLPYRSDKMSPREWLGWSCDDVTADYYASAFSSHVTFAQWHPLLSILQARTS